MLFKDIRFSNSPVEAVHRTIKGRYLRNRKFESIKVLDNYLKWVVKDYNEIRPHYKHRPRTPYEVYFDIPLDFDVRERVKKAIKQRVINNKCAGCKLCTMGCKQLHKSLKTPKKPRPKKTLKRGNFVKTSVHRTFYKIPLFKVLKND